MAHTLMIHDETANGTVINQLHLQIEESEISVAQIIKKRVAQELDYYKQAFSAFQENGFCIKIHDQPVRSLEENVNLLDTPCIRFICLGQERA